VKRVVLSGLDDWIKFSGQAGGFLQVGDVARLLGVSRQRVYELVELGRFTRYVMDGALYLGGVEVAQRRARRSQANGIGACGPKGRRPLTLFNI